MGLAWWATFTAQTAETAASYAVVVSSATQLDPEWRAVTWQLQKKHQATLVVYTNAVTEARPALSRLMPRYTAFVARPEEAGRAFVVAIHRLTRQLDEDPYTDTQWGIVTGYSARDALRIAAATKPLEVRKGAGGTAIPLSVLEEGKWYDEGRKNHMVVKEKGGQPQDRPAPDDTTEELVETLNRYQPDFFMTSGHATERDWQIGYSYKNGQFRCRDGALFGVDTAGNTHPIHSPNPKIYFPAGNCLMGHIKDRQSMALAFMGSGGVNQMIGYTVSTWYGYGGWGVRDYFFDQPGRFTFAEAFYCNQLALVHELETRFPETARVDFPSYDIERNPRLLNEVAARLKLRDPKTAKDNLGLLFDRDVVAFYGDPAWEARVPRQELAWEQSLREKTGTWTFELRARETGSGARNTGQHASSGRPPIELFPVRLKNIKIIEGGDLKPVVADNFLLLGGLRQFEKGRVYRVVFTAEKF